MSMLAQQVASITGAYRPPKPPKDAVMVHLIHDDPDPEPIVHIEATKDGHRFCKGCHEEKPVSEYYWRSGRNCLCTLCKVCYREDSKQRKLARPTKKG